MENVIGHFLKHKKKKNPLYILHQDKSMKDAKTRVRFLMLSLLNNVLF